MANRLAHETSPYLLQHQDNPVDWFPWGPEALQRARDEDKPLLISIGYAACHWCHVMERESFEDPAIAHLMNEGFVCVKVDREERPDIDAIYMDAVQAMTGSGGWPLTMFATPDGVPFYGGTYFPPSPRGGLPAFSDLLDAVRRTWDERRPQVEAQGQALMDHIAAAAVVGSGSVGREDLERVVSVLAEAYDAQLGGFGRAPKFPQPMTIDLLLRRSVRGSNEAAAMATGTLDAMAAGGIFDQIGGGFARYSVDRAWVVPHFEKMLYDNAQLLRTYARSSLATGSERHRDVAQATAGWLLREMQDPCGGFYSSLDADSEGREGLYYLWDIEEVRSICRADADAAIARYGFTEEGNFEGLNIAVDTGVSVDDAALERAHEALFAARTTRTRPATDDKILAGWNALTAACLAEAGVSLGQPLWVEAAATCTDLILSKMRIGGRLMRSMKPAAGDKAPDVRHLAYCEDHAFLLEACLALFDATFEIRWLEEAVWAADETMRLFGDDDGSFFTTGSDAPALVRRPKDVYDNAIPSANSTMALHLQRLGALTGDARYAARARQIVDLYGTVAARAPYGFAVMLAAVDLAERGTDEIVVIGDEASSVPLLRVARSHYVPDAVVVATNRARELEARIPLLAHRDGGERALAYVCRSGVCARPVGEPAELDGLLARDDR